MRVAIVGAGVSGLTLACLIKQHRSDVDLTVFEGSSRCGGWVRSVRKDGFLLELGPNSLRLGSHESVYPFLESLNLVPSFLVPPQEACKKFLISEGKLCPVSLSLSQLLFSPLFKGVKTSWLRDLLADKGSDHEETIAEVFSRRLGSSFAEKIVDPIVKGIWAGDIHRLSMQACFPSLVLLEKQHRSWLQGFWKSRGGKKNKYPPMISFKGGMETFVRAMVSFLGDSICVNSPVMELSLRDTDISITTDSLTSQFDHVYLAGSARSAAGLLQKYNTAISDQLLSIDYQSLRIVHVAFDELVMKQSGFGFLVPSQEKSPIMGAIWNSRVFPHLQPSGKELFTFMVNSLDENIAQEAVLDSLKRHLKIHKAPLWCHHTQAMNAIAQPYVGYLEKIENIENSVKSLHSSLNLLGSSYHGVGIGHCIQAAHKAFDALSCTNKIRKSFVSV